MTVLLNKLAGSIFENGEYREASSLLFDAYVKSLIGEKKQIDKAAVRKLMLTAQIFQKSEDKKIKHEGAAILSMMLDVCAEDYPEIVPIANSVFSNAGDFPNIQLLTKRFPKLNFRYSLYSDAQMEFRAALNTVEELDFPLTDYQRSLWSDLTADQDVITSAPTSAGKTYIILNYLLNKVVNSDESFAAIIVPTRALISEVAGKLYEIAKNGGCEEDIDICTIPRDGDFEDKTFFVMTQERLHEILLRGDISFAYLFIDEAHNISDKSRGVLLHLTIEKMLEDSFPQVIISMPSPNYQDSFSTIFKDVEFKKEITESSPVSKIVMSVVPKGQNLLVNRDNSPNFNTIKKGFKGTKLSDIVFRLGVGQSNIIYRNQTNFCEDMADSIAELIDKNVNSEELEEAANYVEEFIHEDFTLAKNLRKGVAFHYGPLPSSIRIMVENLVKSGRIKFISCTSTLAEGVNLPAKNLFLKNPAYKPPRKSNERLEDVKINNITGRAGRMLEHFSGNIFMVEPDDWSFQDYFDDQEDEEKRIPTYFKSLNEELYSIIQALQGEYSHTDENQYRIYTIANKLINEFSSNQLNNTLNAEELTLKGQELEWLKNSVKKAYESLKVAAFTLEANPTVGYIQQNKLYSFINDQDEYESWVLPHPKSTELYDSLLKVCSILNNFGVYIPTENYNLEYICMITKKWVKGASLKDIISDQIEWDRKDALKKGETPKSTNASVRNVIKVINNDITFRLSNALRCYEILLDNVLISEGLDLTNIKLHAFIEVGASDERMIALINSGLTRETAKDIDDNLNKGEKIASSAALLRLYKEGRLDAIHAISKKEVKELLSQ